VCPERDEPGAPKAPGGVGSETSPEAPAAAEPPSGVSPSSRRSPDSDNRFLRSAFEHAARGRRVFPLHGIVNGRCTCGTDCDRDAGKHPVTCQACELAHGFHDATRDPGQLRRWWTCHPHANIGVVTGDGVMVLDVDGPEGAAAIAAFEREHGPLPATYTVLTGRGRHLYFHTPAEGLVRSGTITHALDVKAAGGYVVAPDSVHLSGKQYTAVGGDPQALALAPAWLLSLRPTPRLNAENSARNADAARGGVRASALRARKRSGYSAHLDRTVSPQLGAQTDHDRTDWPTVARAWLREQYGTERIPEGRRQDTVCQWLAGRLRRAGLAGVDVVAILHAVNRDLCDPPMPGRRLHGLAQRIDRWPTAPSLPPNRTARHMVQAIQHATEVAIWRGRAAHSAHKLLTVYLDTAHRTGGLTVALSVRRGSELAGLSDLTTWRARQRLIALGWLMPSTCGTNGRADAHILRLPPALRNMTFPSLREGRLSVIAGSGSDLAADAFRYGKGRLGPTGWYVLRALDAGAVYPTAVALARATGLAPSTVGKKLKLLAQRKLARNTSAGWQRGPAAFEPTYHRRDQDRVLHRAQRALRHANLKQQGLPVEVPTPQVTLEELRRHSLARPQLVTALQEQHLLADADLSVTDRRRLVLLDDRLRARGHRPHQSSPSKARPRAAPAAYARGGEG
jgi:hypothetical protein